MDVAAIARLTCLQNAVQHEGVCQPKALMGRLMGAHPEFRDDPGAVMQALLQAGAEVNGMALVDQIAALAAEAPELLSVQKKERKIGLPPLPGEGKKVLRFAPNPNGPLSFGHGRGVAIMAEYMRQGAALILRYDDTDPQVKPPLYDPENGVDAYEMIAHDFAWLSGQTPTKRIWASDNIATYHDHALQVIATGGAYVCTCEAEEWRNKKNAGTPCDCRALSASDNRARFQDMVAGHYAQGSAVLRIKTDIQHKDPALRDWTAFRIVAADAIHPREAAGEIAHHVCWPLLDFESAVEDHLQGVTHIIRGKDLMDSTRKQEYLYKHLGWDYPYTLYWGRVSVHEFGKFSTSGMRKGIEAGEYEGWNDPRLPTLQALRRRGFDPGALQAFWVSLGLTQKDIAVSMENVEAANGKALDDKTPRFFFVPDAHKMGVSGMEGLAAKPLLHPPHEARGKRTIHAHETIYIPGDEAGHKQLRLKDLGNVVVAGGSAFFAGVELDRTMPIVQWLPTNDAAPFTVLKPVGDELQEINGFMEPAALQHEVVQCERFGFVRIESPAVGIFLHK